MPSWVGRPDNTLDGKEFYLKVGRKDLADIYSRWNTVRWTGMIGGPVLTGGVFALAALAGSGVPQLLITVLAQVGLAAGVSSWFIDPHPLGAADRYRLADIYNKRLRQQLGLEQGPAAASPLESASPGPLPVAGLSAYGLGVGGTF